MMTWEDISSIPEVKAGQWSTLQATMNDTFKGTLL